MSSNKLITFCTLLVITGQIYSMEREGLRHRQGHKSSDEQAVAPSYQPPSERASNKALDALAPDTTAVGLLNQEAEDPIGINVQLVEIQTDITKNILSQMDKIEIEKADLETWSFFVNVRPGFSTWSRRKATEQLNRYSHLLDALLAIHNQASWDVSTKTRFYTLMKELEANIKANHRCTELNRFVPDDR